MIKTFTSITIITGLLFTSCNKNKITDSGENHEQPNKVTINIENGSQFNDAITEVRMEKLEPEPFSEDFIPKTISTAKYNNGNITFDLPATMPTTEIDKIPSPEEADEGETIIENTFKVSDENARIFIVDFSTYKSELQTGVLLYGTEEKDDNNSNVLYNAIYIYADRHVDLTGKYVNREDGTGYLSSSSFDVSLKKGWNTIYVKYTQTENSEEDISSSKPFPNIQLKWYTYLWYDQHPTQTTHFKTSAKKSSSKNISTLFTNKLQGRKQ